MPLANADILALMKQKQLDGAWVPEPWTTRLIDEAGGELLVDERDRWPDKKFPTTVLVVTKKLATEHPELVQKLVDANVATIAWMKAHPDEARKLVDTGLQKWAKKALPEELAQEGLRQRRAVGGAARRRAARSSSPTGARSAFCPTATPPG